MVVTSGNETIVRFDRERIRGYHISASVLFFFAAVVVVFGLDQAAGYSLWRNKLAALADNAYYFVPGAFVALKLYQYIAADSLDAADRWMGKLFDAFEALAQTLA